MRYSSKTRKAATPLISSRYSTVGRILLIAALLLSILPFSDDVTNVTEGSIYRQAIWGGVFLLAGTVVWLENSLVLRVLQQVHPIFFIFFGYVGLSIIWSPLPIVSIKRFVQICGVILIVLSFRATQSKDVCLFDIVSLPVGIILALSLGAGLFFPQWSVHMDGAWRGVTVHKNNLGQVALIGGILFGLRANLRNFAGRIASCNFILSLLLLFLSQSTTCLMVFLFIFLLSVCFRIPNILLFVTTTQIVTVIFIAMVFIGLPSLNEVFEFVPSLFDKNLTLTGRTYLWDLILIEISKHPWFGVGYGGFWLGNVGSSGALISQLNWGPPTQAHNGYLDLVNEVGFFGLGLFFYFISNCFKKCLNKINNNDDSSTYSLLFLLTIMFLNVSETSFLKTTNFLSIIFVAVFFEISLRFGEKKQESVI